MTKYSRERKGLSTIVGSIIFVILMITGFSSMIAALDYQSEIVSGLNTIAEKETQLVQERLAMSVSVLADPLNKLVVNVGNSGSNFAEIDWVLVVNVDDNTVALDSETELADRSIAPGDSQNVIASLFDVILTNDKTYKIKAVSTLGTVLEKTISPTSLGGDPSLSVELFIDPPNISSGEELILVMLVYNKGTSVLEEVEPGTLSPACTASICTETSPMEIEELQPGESGVFTWRYTLLGAIGTSQTFSGSATAINADSGAVVDSNTDVTSAAFIEGIEKERVQDDLNARIKLYTAFASPMGEAGTKKSYLAIVLANPTNTNMTVSQVSFQFLPPEGAKNLITKPVTGVKPATNWKPASIDGNAVFWEDSTTPITITSYSAQEWIVKAETKDQPSEAELPINAIMVNAYTSFGQFSKTGYSMSMSKDKIGVPNLYQSSSSAGTDQLYYLPNVTPNTARDYFFTVSNTGEKDSTGSDIDANSYVIVNIPTGFTYNSATLPAGMVLDPLTPATMDDGSRHVKVKLTSAIPAPTGAATEVKKTFTLNITAPNLADTASVDTQMYLFYMLITGTTTDKSSNKHTLGSVSETVVQVVKA